MKKQIEEMKDLSFARMSKIGEGFMSAGGNMRGSANFDAINASSIEHAASEDAASDDMRH